MSFNNRLEAAIAKKGCAIAFGLDPRADRLPPKVVHESANTLDALERFGRELIECLYDIIPAIKLQIAFFEEHGPSGIDLYFRLIRVARDAGLIVIGDVKRGDIGSTAAAYARAHISQVHSADAITINPYFGTDGLQPFLDAAVANERGLYVLVKTSNPSSAEIQDLRLGKDLLYCHVADLVSAWGRSISSHEGYHDVGAVVGATHPNILKNLRSRMLNTPFLVPGYGAQGATAQDVRFAFDRKGFGALIAASRSISQAFENDLDCDWQLASRNAAEVMRDELAKVQEPSD